jgi:uncharacterized protein DUF4255
VSGPLAIAAVTAALKDLLDNGLLDHDLSSLGSVTVTAVPPDRVTTGQTESNQLNLFLYQVTPNQGWRNEGLPSRDGNGTRLTNPPLGVDLHYILTAYGSKDFNAEALLGYAMLLLHETPVISREQLRTVLGGTSPVDGSILPSVFGTLSAADLADQVEQIKITPVTLSNEDLSKMWTAMQARYRPTVAYMVSVVLIQATGPTRSALPVLKRGKEDRGPTALAAPFPFLTGISPAASDALPAVRLGDDLLLSGTNLEAQGTVTMIFESVRTGRVKEITSPPASGGALVVHLPSVADDANAMNEWSAGFYTVALRVERADAPLWISNRVAIGLAPSITVAPTTGVPGDKVTVTCTPRLLPEQASGATLVFGSRTMPPASIDTPADTSKPTTLTFAIPDVPKGKHPVRLRVDGVDSLPITITGPGAKLDFDSLQRVTVS